MSSPFPNISLFLDVRFKLILILFINSTATSIFSIPTKLNGQNIILINRNIPDSAEEKKL